MTSLFIVGSGGFAKDVIWLIDEINGFVRSNEKPISPLGFIAPEGDGRKIRQLPVLGNDEWAIQHLTPSTRFVVAVGASHVRKKIAEKFEMAGFDAYNLMHPGVAYGMPVQGPGKGTMICAGVKISLDTTIGRHVLLNLNCTIGHDVVLEDYVTVSPGANISGNVHLESCVEIGSGAVVLPGVRIGAGAVLGAGAVATRDLAGGKTYVGIPAKPLPLR